MTTPSVRKPHYALFIFDRSKNLLLSSKEAEEINSSLGLVNISDNHMTSINGIRDDLLDLAINSVEDGNVMEFTLPIEINGHVSYTVIRLLPLQENSGLVAPDGPLFCLVVEDHIVPDRYCVSHMAKEFGLTVTEEMILADLLEGWTTDEIIKKMNVSPSTFPTHLSRIRNKVGCNATMEVVLMALKRANHIKATSSKNA